jgi:hypothetical protein
MYVDIHGKLPLATSFSTLVGLHAPPSRSAAAPSLPPDRLGLGLGFDPKPQTQPLTLDTHLPVDQQQRHHCPPKQEAVHHLRVTWYEPACKFECLKAQQIAIIISSSCSSERNDDWLMLLVFPLMQ